jgi:hypothetical protein
MAGTVVRKESVSETLCDFARLEFTVGSVRPPQGS